MRLRSADLFSWFEKSATVVTPSRLLAAVAYEQFASAQLGTGHESWRRPAILSLGAWLTSLWQNARYSQDGIPALLSPAQEHLLWKRIIEEDQLELFDLNATGRLASRAAKLLAEWEIPSDGEQWYDHADAAQFQRWLHSLRRTCKREGWIIRADLWHYLPEWISRSLCASDEVFFTSTEPVFPALRRVLRALGNRAALEQPATPAVSPPQASGQSFDDFERELQFAARWARAALEADSQYSIGVFVPDLATHRSLVERSFNQVCYPASYRELVHPAASRHIQGSAFHINKRAPLEGDPLLAGALLLLQLAHPRIPIGDAAAILRSPWIRGAVAERSARAMTDLDLRKRRELDVTLGDLEFASSRCSLLTKIWAAVRQSIRQKKPFQTFAAWSEFIGDLLHSLGWPGEQELSSREQESVEAWKDALSELSTLSFVAGAITFEAALAQLRSLLAGGSETNGLSAPIQILDSTEAATLQFDRAILTGLSEQTWPPPVYASALIPLKLQREHCVPASSPHSACAERERITAALFGTAPALVATWSGRLSPLAESFVISEKEELLVWKGKLSSEAFRPAILDEIEDSQAPPFHAGELARGGTGIIKSQSLCPFRAFSEFRLQANSPEEGCLGLDARDRGGYLHRALQFVWQNLKSRDRLRAASPTERKQLVEAAVAQAVKEDRSSPFHEIVTAVELERLNAVILEWLSIESERPQAFEVQTVEGEQQFNLAGLQLRLRVDRVDRLANGKLLLIDYKSGKQTRNKLKSPRPQEPQLLVYAASAGHDVDGVYFAELKPRDSRAVGIGREKYFRGHSVDAWGSGWDSFLAESEAEVTRLAAAFLRGDAVVDPLPGACAYCAQKPICRINELGGQEETDE